MLAKSKEGAHSLAVFGQDVLPDILMDPPDSNAIIRQYLDAGGSVLWMGDTPCFFIGREGVLQTHNLENMDKRWFLNTAFITIFGVLPVISVPLHTVKIKRSGRDLGLSCVWSSIRPIIKDKSINVLAATTSLFASETISIRRINILKRFLQKVNRVEIGATGGALQLNAGSGAIEFSNRRSAYETYASAWFKNYGAKRKSGFFRIWDLTISSSLIDSRREEISNIIENIKRRLGL
jgi:hypothetical protein